MDLTGAIHLLLSTLRPYLLQYFKSLCPMITYCPPPLPQTKAQTMILNGQVPHLTGFTRAVFAPGDEVELHRHKSMDEVFYSAEGKGVIEVDGTVVQVI